MIGIDDYEKKNKIGDSLLDWIKNGDCPNVSTLLWAIKQLTNIVNDLHDDGLCMGQFDASDVRIEYTQVNHI